MAFATALQSAPHEIGAIFFKLSEDAAHAVQMSGRMRSVVAALLLLAAVPMFGASNAPARDVFPELKHERVDYWVAEFSKDKDYHKKIAEGFERKAKYQEMLERKLRRRGMPQNLIYLAFEESAFNPEARSGQRAVGIWQLMPATAKLYGLKVSRKTDDRLKVEKETDAALRFLDHLYRYFGSWYLAAAAYNAGEQKIARIMKKKLRRHTGRDRDYYRIWDDLPPQTRDYVPAILALERIGRNPKKYGF